MSNAENSVSRETNDKLEHYLALLKKWQSKINLVSNSTIDDAWDRHFVDSMQVEPLLPKTEVLFDLGCGAGFPGLVLAIMRPEINVSLIESDQKKCSFMRTVSRETETPVTIYNERIEKTDTDIVPDIITARALASLSELFDYCEKWISANPKIQLIFLKGAKTEEELENLRKNWKFSHKSYDSKTSPDGKILVFSDICPV